MRKSRFSEAQIVAILREFDAGAPAEELGRRHGIHPNTIRLWRSKYAGMSASDLARLQQLEAENAQMQRIIARQSVKIVSLLGYPYDGGLNQTDSAMAIGDAELNALEVGRLPANKWKVERGIYMAATMGGAACTPSDK